MKYLITLIFFNLLLSYSSWGRVNVLLPNLPPPDNTIKTGNDHHSSSYKKSGTMDTTPVDDTGTEKDRPVFRPWFKPLLRDYTPPGPVL